MNDEETFLAQLGRERLQQIEAIVPEIAAVHWPEAMDGMTMVLRYNDGHALQIDLRVTADWRKP